MLRQPPRSTRTDTLFPYTSLFRSASSLADLTLIYCGKAEFGQIFRSFSLNSPAIRPKRPKNLPQIGFPSLRSVKPDRLLERETSRTAAVAHILCYIELVEKARKCDPRSEEHTSELQSLMRISYAVFCLKKKNIIYE